jgi:hypothetical protein
VRARAKPRQKSHTASQLRQSIGALAGPSMSDAYDDAEETNSMINGRKRPAVVQKCAVPKWFYAGVLLLGLVGIFVLAGSGSDATEAAASGGASSLGASASSSSPTGSSSSVPRSAAAADQATMQQMVAQLSDLQARVATMQNGPSPDPSSGEQDIQATLQVSHGRQSHFDAPACFVWRITHEIHRGMQMTLLPMATTGRSPGDLRALRLI